MPISFTDDAINLIADIMKKEGLEPQQYAMRIFIEDGTLQFKFDDDIEGHKQAGTLKFFDDPRIEEDIVIATFRTSDGRAGVIFLGKNELAQ